MREKGFYILNGILVYVESVDWEERELKISLKDPEQGTMAEQDAFLKMGLSPICILDLSKATLHEWVVCIRI